MSTSMSERVHPMTYLGSVLLSLVAVAFLIWLVYFKPAVQQQQDWVAYLPWVNAFFNSCAAYQLLQGWSAIRRKQIPRHRSHMLKALGCSSLFLLSYILYHSLHGDTVFPQLGWIRTLYLLLLVSHIGLSILVLPIILISLALAYLGRFELHPKFARIALPIWLYVSVTGVMIVVFLQAALA